MNPFLPEVSPVTPETPELAVFPQPGRNRAWRRGRRAHFRAHRRYYGVALGGWRSCEVDFEQTQRILGRVARTPKACSCYGCSTSRKVDGLTRQELRQHLNLKDGLTGLALKPALP
jgi:hypothetical protein